MLDSKRLWFNIYLLLCLLVVLVQSQTNLTNITNPTDEDDDGEIIVETVVADADIANYPADLFNYDKIRKGGFILYLFGTYPNSHFSGMMYAFLGISLVTKNFINPSIDIIKKKNVVSLPSPPLYLTVII